MAFYQNPFTTEFRGTVNLGSAITPNFIIPRNVGRSDETVTSQNGSGPFDLSGNDAAGNPTKILTIRFATDSGNFLNWGTKEFDIAATATEDESVQLYEIVSALNNNVDFQQLFTASHNNVGVSIHLRNGLGPARVKFYVVNGGAEEVLRFNGEAAIREIPAYFSRYTVGNDTGNDLPAMLVPLDPADAGNALLINGAGFDSTKPTPEYKLYGRNSSFSFTKSTVDGNTRSEVKYPSGAEVGDIATKKVIVKDNDGNVIEEYVLPHTLTEDDIITPP